MRGMLLFAGILLRMYCSFLKNRSCLALQLIRKISLSESIIIYFSNLTQKITQKCSHALLIFGQILQSPCIFEDLICIFKSYFGMLRSTVASYIALAGVDNIIGSAITKNTNLRYINIDWILIAFIPQMKQYKAVLIVNINSKIGLQCRILVRWLWVLYFLTRHHWEHVFQLYAQV